MTTYPPDPATQNCYDMPCAAVCPLASLDRVCPTVSEVFEAAFAVTELKTAELVPAPA